MYFSFSLLAIIACSFLSLIVSAPFFIEKMHKLKLLLYFIDNAFLGLNKKRVAIPFMLLLRYYGCLMVHTKMKENHGWKLAMQ